MKRTLLLIAFLCATIAASAQSPESGYRSYVDLGYTFAAGAQSPEGHLDLATSHGYIHNGWLYAGGGVGLSWFVPHEVAMPIFGEVRGFIPNKRGSVKPYFGLRAGVSCGISEIFSENWGGEHQGSGAYMVSTFGVEDRRFDYSISYVWQRNYGYNVGNGIMLRIGYRFGK